MNFHPLRDSTVLLSDDGRYVIAKVANELHQAWKRQTPQSVDLGTFKSEANAIYACRRDASRAELA
jgi:hypothetical protein